MSYRLLCSLSLTALLLTATVDLTTADSEEAPPEEAEKKAELSVRSAGSLGGFDEWVTSTAVSPNGGFIATGSYDRITVWDAESLKSVKDIKGKLGRVRSLVFTPDGSRLIAAGFRRIVIYGTDDWAEQQELSGHRAYVTGLALHPDGTSLVSSSEDATARIWDLETGESRVLFREQEDPVMSVTYSADGKLLAAASGDDTRPTRPGHVRIYRADTGERVRDLDKHVRVATGVAFSPDGTLLASTSQDETVHVYSVETGELLRIYEGHSRPTNAVHFLSNDQVVSVSGGRAVGKNETHIWDPETGQTLAKFEEHKGPVFDVAIAANGSRLVTASGDASAIVWQVGDAAATPVPVAAAEVRNPVLDAVSAFHRLIKLAGKAQPKSDPEQPDKKDADKEPGSDDALALSAIGAVSFPAGADDAGDAANTEEKIIRIGMIGLDTSHCLAFAKLLNMKDDKQYVPGCRLVGVYPKGSPDIQSSVSRVPKYMEEIQKYGVKIVDDLDDLVAQVDAILLETNDGRPHLEQVIPALKAGLPVFIDKPIAGSLTDAVAIFELSKHYKTPLFSSSSLRYSTGAQALRNGSLGEITGCSTYSPASLEKTHPDLFWYGIHGVEMLFTVMGPGCKSITRAHSKDFDLVTGTWEDGRIGTFRGIRSGGSGYGGTAFGTKGVSPVGKYDGYRPLAVEFVKFFQTKEVPISEQETLEIYAFMEAADESKRRDGAPVTLESVLAKARGEAARKVREITGRK
jgi:WD40 repeat protein/predicted dehydrogenase